jgi:hypothetical protein
VEVRIDSTLFHCMRALCIFKFGWLRECDIMLDVPATHSPLTSAANQSHSFTQPLSRSIKPLTVHGAGLKPDGIPDQDARA